MEPDAAHARVLELLSGYRVTQALHVAVVLGVPDLLAGGGRSAQELAAAADANEDSLYRLLRALAALGVLHEDGNRRFTLTELGERLRTDDERSAAGWARFLGSEAHWALWGAFEHSIRAGESAAEKVLGMSVWEYRAGRPEESAVFDRAMVELTRGVNAAVVAAYDFAQFDVVVDVGGGQGALLAAILQAAPDARGIVFDQEHVLERAALPDRAEAVAGSFFESVPEGADAYVLKSVIHDWDDEESVAILRTCRAAMKADAKLLLVERDLGGANEHAAAKLSDLNMLVGPGGRERTLDEYEQLFAEAGLSLSAAVPTGTGWHVIEAVPA